MNIAIIDDFPSDQQFLVESISHYCDQNFLEIQLNYFDDGASFLKEFAVTDFDIIFLDIYMHGMNGMEIAERIREQDNQCLLIFTTTSEQHAVRSFRVRAFDYLVKPYSYEQLAEVMYLCIKALPKRSYYIEVKLGRNIKKILLSDILFTDYSNHYIQIHTKSQMIKTYMDFDTFAPKLLCFPQFLCCYRNCIVNMDAVEMMLEQDFILQNEERVPIAKARRNEIRQQYADYVFGKLHGNI